MFEKLYKNSIIEKPKFTLSILIVLLLSFGYFSKNFQLDASSDTLLLENDPDLKYLREVSANYGHKDYFVLTYSPNENLLSPNTITNLTNLKNELINLEWSNNVITILDVPLLKNNDDPLMERIKNFKTLSSKDVDKERGFKEIINSPVYNEYVISNDGKTSGILVFINPDDKMSALIKTKNEYLDKINNNQLNSKEKKNYKKFLKKYDDYKKIYNKKNHQNVNEIRNVIEKYKKSAEIHLGGIPMIADDMMTYVKNDIMVFGIGVFLFIICTLWFVFRTFIWVFIPLLSCFFSVFIMVGILGLLGWKVTVISSNFIALMLILTMAMNIHISVRYLQFKKENPNISNSEAILWTSEKMFWPILYTALTTICAFLSLIFSGIKPIIDFGWMMTVGLLVSLLITFTLLPSVLNILSNKNENYKNQENDKKSKITSFLSNFTQKKTKTIFTSAFLVIVISIFGITKLEVENSFINYFDKETEIYKGMKLIDNKLGGTTPLDVIIKFPDQDNTEETDDDFDSWDDEDGNEEKYWFTRNKINKITQVHDYLDSLEAVGKVISFASMIRVAEDLYGGGELQGLEIGVLYTKIPESIKKDIINPYISIKNNEARISLRILDSKENLRRNELIKKIKYDLENKLGLDKKEYKLAGVLILFNNLLQSLFKSQILTLGFVMAGISAMFLILFRNVTLSLIGVVPNFMAAFLILGIIGLLGIPLDMMTITIAAITIGIAVDNSIHYIYRFKEEFTKNRNYSKTLEKCHNTVGVAILNTSITIVFGFSILVLSNFIPTIYFGFFTGVAMLLAMISVLTLLPKLILVIKPFGKE
ncbi:MMPL family transporter [Pelagibacteraceae bacterium]|nr:MMPL family transporter [Pelagibacteraceae bacterium]